jgi:hypothetical protein
VSAAAEPVRELFGLTGLCAGARERVPVRTRGSGVTTSAWRLEVVADQGTGAIVLVEISPRESHCRGEGLFFGWPPERLAAVHDALLPRPDEPGFDLPQLG